mgnify:CR=1 FL=1|jgi:HK97 family phage portal protein|tara:strand:- start:1358 stop:3559 length:2202 start_codon:yes stop_codon:yes gene_type:complete
MLFENLLKRTEQELKDIELETKATNANQLLGDIETILGLGVSPKKKVEDYLKSSIGWVYSCVDSISNELANVQLTLFRKKENGEVEEIEKHQILDLLSRANNNTTKFDLFYLTQNYLELAGEAPWFLEYKAGKPSNIFLLRPDRLTVKPPKKEGELIGGYTYKVFKDGIKEIDLEPFEIIFLKYPDPTKPFRGKGTLEAAVRTFDIDEKSEQYSLKFFSNSATPNSILSTDKKLTREVKDKLRRELKVKHEGIDNAHKTLILEGGLDWKPMALSQREMDFIETMRFTRDKILAIFRVPKSVLGLTEDVNRANAEAADFTFAKRTIKPKMQKLVEMLNEFLLPLFDDTGTLFLDFEDPVPENLELKLKTAREGITAGYLSPNEARALLGYDPVDGGDEILNPATPNVPPSKMGAKGFGKKLKLNKHFIYASRKRSERHRKAKAVKGMVETQVAKNVSSVVYSQLLTKAEDKKRMKNLKVDARKSFDGKKESKLAFQTEQLRVGEEFEQRFINQMNRIFKDQRDKILAKLPKKADDNKLLDVEKETKETIKKLRPIITFLIGIQSAKAFQLLGQDRKLSERNNEAVAEYLERRIFKFARDVTLETNKQVGKVLANAVRDEVGVNEVTKRIRAKFSQFIDTRSNRIARSEIIRATSFATEETFVVSEVVELKEWLTFIDERTDQECIDMNGKTLKLGKNYFDQGAKFGRIHLDYEDIAGPPLHSNCRCTLVPVVAA